MSGSSRTSVSLDGMRADATQHSQLIARQTPQYHSDMEGLNPLNDSFAQFFGGASKLATAAIEPIADYGKVEAKRQAMTDDMNGEPMPVERDLWNYHYYNARTDLLGQRTAKDLHEMYVEGASKLQDGQSIDAYTQQFVQDHVSSIHDENLKLKVYGNLRPAIDLTSSQFKLDRFKKNIEKGSLEADVGVSNFIASGKNDPVEFFRIYQNYLDINPSDMPGQRQRALATAYSAISNNPDKAGAAISMLRDGYVGDTRLRDKLFINEADLTKLEDYAQKRVADGVSFGQFKQLSDFDTRLSEIAKRSEPLKAVEETAHLLGEVTNYGWNNNLQYNTNYTNLIGKIRGQFDALQKSTQVINQGRTMLRDGVQNTSWWQDHGEEWVKAQHQDLASQTTPEGRVGVISNYIELGRQTGWWSNTLRTNLSQDLINFRTNPKSAADTFRFVSQQADKMGVAPEVAAKTILGDGDGLLLWHTINSRRQAGASVDVEQMLQQLATVKKDISDPKSLTPKAVTGKEADAFYEDVGSAMNKYFVQQLSQPGLGNVNGIVMNSNVHVSPGYRGNFASQVLQYMNDFSISDIKEATSNLLASGNVQGELLPSGNGDYHVVPRPPDRKGVRFTEDNADVARADIKAVSAMFPQHQDSGNLLVNPKAWFLEADDNAGKWFVRDRGGAPVALQPGQQIRWKDAEGAEHTDTLSSDPEVAAQWMNERVKDVLGTKNPNIEGRIVFAPMIPGSPNSLLTWSYVPSEKPARMLREEEIAKSQPARPGAKALDEIPSGGYAAIGDVAKAQPSRGGGKDTLDTAVLKAGERVRDVAAETTSAIGKGIKKAVEIHTEPYK